MDKTNIKRYEGSFHAKGLKFGIVCSRFNDFFVKHLLDGAIDTILRHEGISEDITVAWVPGSYELPVVVNRFASSGKFDSVISLGVVIQGGTSHAQYINSHVSSKLGEISLATGIPVIFGVVTTETIEQAVERCGTKSGNRGESAARAAIEMANLMKKIPPE